MKRRSFVAALAALGIWKKLPKVEEPVKHLAPVLDPATGAFGAREIDPVDRMMQVEPPSYCTSLSMQSDIYGLRYMRSVATPLGGRDLKVVVEGSSDGLCWSPIQTTVTHQVVVNGELHESVVKYEHPRT